MAASEGCTHSCLGTETQHAQMVPHAQLIAYTAMQPQTAKQKTKPHLRVVRKEERNKAVQ